MSTIETLMLGTGVDLAGLTQGLAGANSAIRRFAETVRTPNVGTGIADDLIITLTAELNAKRGALEDALSRNVIRPQIFAALAQQAADEFATGLKRGLGQLAAAGLVTDEVRGQFVSAYQAIGQQAGGAFGLALQQQVQRNQAVAAAAQGAAQQAAGITAAASAERGLSTAMTTTEAAFARRLADTRALTATTEGLVGATRDAVAAQSAVGAQTERTGARMGLLARFTRDGGDEFTHLGKKGVEALFGIGTVLAAVATDAQDTTQRVENVLRTIEGFGLFLGTKGLIISAVAATLEAIVSLVTHTNEEMKKAREGFEDQVRQMAQAGDLTALQVKMQNLLRSDPRAEAFLHAQGVGLADMQKQAANLQGQLEWFRAHPVETFFEFPPDAIASTKARLHDVQEAMKPLQGEFQRLQEAANNPLPALKGTGLLPPVTVEGKDPTTVAKDVQRLGAAVSALTALLPVMGRALQGVVTPGFEPLTESADRLVEIVNTRALAAYDRVTNRLREQHGVIDATTAALVAMQRSLAAFTSVKVLRIEVPRVTPIELPVDLIIDKVPDPKQLNLRPIEYPAIIKLGVTDIGPIAATLARVTALRQAAEATGNTQEAIRLRAAETAQALNLVAAERNVLGALRAQHAPAQVVKAAIDAMAKAMKDAGVDASVIERALNRQGVVGQLRDAADAARGLGDAFGNIGQRAGAALDSVATLVEQVKNLDTTFGKDATFAGVTSAITSIVGAIGVVGSALGSIFGPSPDELALRQAMTQNTDAVNRLRSSVDHWADSANSIGASQAAVSKLLANNGLQRFLDRAPQAPQSSEVAFIREVLRDTGVTFEQLKALADQYGITLFRDGQYVHGSLQKLGEALGVTADSLLKWGDTFEAQTQLAKLRARATGTDSPLQSLQDELAAFKDRSKGLFDKYFAGIDVTSAAGQKQFREAIVKLLDAIKSGAVSLSDLGNFGNVQDVGTAIGDFLDSLDGLSSATNKVTDALLNVPEGFKLALARFRAQAPEIVAGQSPTAIPPLPQPTPPPPTVSLEVGAQGVNLGKSTLDQLAALLTLLNQGTTSDTSRTMSTGLAQIRDALAAAVRDLATPPGDTSSTKLAKLTDTLATMTRQLAPSVADATAAQVGTITDTLAGLARELTPPTPDPVVSGIAALASQLAATDDTLTAAGVALNRDTLEKLAQLIATRGAGGGGDVFHVNGPIQVDAKDKPIAQVVDDLVRELRRRSRSGFSPIAGVSLPQ